MSEDLRRVAVPGSHEIEIKKSRFICTVSRVESDAQAREFIACLKKQYWQANHNCSAYVIGERGEVQRSNDDGEPSGTAGTPMLEVLRKMHLTDTVAVVSRYFGGTLLGAGGLIRAYGSAVSETIRQIGIVQRRILNVVAVDVSHGEAGRIHNALLASHFPEATVSYGSEGVRFVLNLEQFDLKPFGMWLAESTNGSLSPETLGQTKIDVSIDESTIKE